MIPHSPVDPSTRHVLLVEDHSPTTAIMARLIRNRGFPVLTASTLAEARRLARKHPVGFVISDLGLGDGDGCELMRELHLRLGIAGAAVTGYGMESDLQRTREAGFVLHLTKPISVTDLEKLLILVGDELAKPARPRPRSDCP